MNKNQLQVGRVSPSGVTRQVVDAVEDVGLRCANPTYGVKGWKVPGMHKPIPRVGRVSPQGVTRQVVDAVTGVGLRCANPTYGAGV